MIVVLTANFMLPTEKGTKCMKFFSAVLFIGIAVTIQNCVIILKRPHELHFLTSILEDPKKIPVLGQLPFIACNFWIWANTWVTRDVNGSFLTLILFRLLLL